MDQDSDKKPNIRGIARKIQREVRQEVNRPARVPPPPNRAAARARLAARKAAVRQPAAPRQPQPQPRPAAPRPAASRPAAGLTPEVKAQISSLQQRFTSLEGRSQLSDVYDAIGEIEHKLTNLPLELDGLRDRGYVHSGQLEDRLAAVDEQWDDIRSRVESTLQQQVNRLDADVDSAIRLVNNAATGNAAAVSAAERAVSGLDSKISAAQRAVSNLYDNPRNELQAVEQAIGQSKWMIEQLEESPEIQLYEAEGPIVAVETQWQRDGKEGPEGVLYLTDQRVLFEQKEEIKKKLGLFKSESEKLHKLLLDIAASDIESTAHSEEGGFLGMGKADILELVCSSNAPVSRARFHLKGQNSSEWAALIKRVQNGDIDADRAEEYLEAVSEAEAAAGSFPAQCPNCFAAVIPPPRGVTRINCEFCGSVITAG
ncbi:MAG: hypothetical protein L0332_17575 [Chloroflexi bacterium]|nr:hypothetical protein [Chloroflexota bacterium]MCI0580344.1 hypothetical protein [Chloroflexota bacterium]MCI0648509.1 hypothetical protein [Chloroflexota bacterium]MCI0728511.1 hypothetical protein [Chloroflexota bacterium]